jgi:hypothetical protein
MPLLSRDASSLTESSSVAVARTVTPSRGRLLVMTATVRAAPWTRMGGIAGLVAGVYCDAVGKRPSGAAADDFERARDGAQMRDALRVEHRPVVEGHLRWTDRLMPTAMTDRPAETRLARAGDSITIVCGSRPDATPLRRSTRLRSGWSWIASRSYSIARSARQSKPPMANSLLARRVRLEARRQTRELHDGRSQRLRGNRSGVHRGTAEHTALDAAARRASVAAGAPRPVRPGRIRSRSGS